MTLYYSLMLSVYLKHTNYEAYKILYNHITLYMSMFLSAPKNSRGVGRLLVIILEGANLTGSKDGKG